MGKYTMFMDCKNQYSENDYSIQSNLQIQCNPYQATKGIFHRTRIKNFTICMETQKNLEQPKQSGERRMELEESTCLTSDYNTKYSHQDSMVLAQRQKYRLMEQNRKLRDKSMHPWTPYL